MSQPFVGEIRMFAGNFAPQGWDLCNGQVLSIAGNETLFTLIGTTYGGDGQNTFALPDLRSRAPIHQGNEQGNGFVLGQVGGTETVSLTTTQLPAHNHLLGGSNGGDQVSPENACFSTDPAGNTAAYNDASTGTATGNGLLANVGGGQPHDNMQPFLVINYIISLFGIYPSQN